MKSTVAVIVFGIVAWISAGVIALAVNASANVLWICFVGVFLGLVGLRYTIRRAKRSGI